MACCATFNFEGEITQDKTITKIKVKPTIPPPAHHSQINDLCVRLKIPRKDRPSTFPQAKSIKKEEKLSFNRKNTLFYLNGRKLGGILGVSKVREGHDLLDEQGSGRGKRLVGGTRGGIVKYSHSSSNLIGLGRDKS